MTQIRGLSLSVLALMAAGAVEAQAQDSVKIGALLIDSGPLAAFYQYTVKGLETGVAEVNAKGGVNGKPLELVQMTYAGTPESGVQTATRLVKDDKVAAVTGMTTTPVGLALSGRATALDTIVVDALGASSTRCNKNFFRVKASDAMQAASYAAFLKDHPLETWDIIAGENTSGHNNADSFTRIVEAQGGKIGKALFTPAPNPDFGTYITQLNQAPSKGLMAIVYGSDAVTFAKQQQQFGLTDKYEMILGNNFAIPAVVQAMGESAIGVVQNVNYIPAAEGDGPRPFSDAFTTLAGFEPDDVAFDMYMSVLYLAAAMNKAGSEEAAAVSDALEGLVLDSPVGPLEMRAADHQMARPSIFAEVVAAAEPTEGKTVEYQIKRIVKAEEYMPEPSADCKM